MIDGRLTMRLTIYSLSLSRSVALALSPAKGLAMLSILTSSICLKLFVISACNFLFCFDIWSCSCSLAIVGVGRISCVGVVEL
jgi:hypothetical protein